MSDDLTGGSYDSLDEMMTHWAAQAVLVAAAEHGMSLDYSPQSIPSLEAILAARGPSEPDAATRLWGGYFGEIFRRKYGGTWIMNVYPGGEMAMPALDIGGSHVYPLLKVFRRITMGPGESLAAFYEKVATALDAASSASGTEHGR